MITGSRISHLYPYQQAEQKLRDYILLHRAKGYKLPSTGDLAQEFGVSVPTIRKALSQLVREGLLEAHKNSGYFVADSLVSTGPVAILYDIDLSQIRFANTVVRQILECQEHLEALGLDSRIYLGRKPLGEASEKLYADKLLKDISRGAVSAVVSLSGRVSTALSLATREANIPHLGTGKYYMHGVTYDFDAFFRKAVSVALKHGRRKIAYSAMQYLHPELASDSRAVTRILKELGLYKHTGWIREDWHNSIKGAGWDSFRSLWRAAPERPDALIIGSPVFAHEVEQAMRDHGIRCPDDLLIICAATKDDPTTDDLPWPRIEANLQLFGKNFASMVAACIKEKNFNPGMHYVDYWEINDPYTSDTQSFLQEEIPNIFPNP